MTNEEKRAWAVGQCPCHEWDDAQVKAEFEQLLREQVEAQAVTICFWCVKRAATLGVMK